MTVSPYELACLEALELMSKRPRYYCQPVADLDQLRQLWEIDKAAYQDCSLSFEGFERWWSRYQFGSRLLLDGDRIVASIGIYPLSEPQATSFAAGDIPERDLMPVSLHQCDDEPQHYWYASGIVVNEADRGYGSPLRTLLRFSLGYWAESQHVAYPLHLIAIAEYEIGARLLKTMGFVKIKDGGELPDGCDLYQVTYNDEHALRAALRQRGLC